MSTLRISTKLRNDTDSIERQINGTSITTTGGRFDWVRRIIGTAEETFAISGDLSNGIGFAHFYNADATNYVQVGIATTSYFMRLKAGEHAVLPLDNAVTTLYLKANTASVELEMYITER